MGRIETEYSSPKPPDAIVRFERIKPPQKNKRSRIGRTKKEKRPITILATNPGDIRELAINKNLKPK